MISTRRPADRLPTLLANSGAYSVRIECLKMAAPCGSSQNLINETVLRASRPGVESVGLNESQYSSSTIISSLSPIVWKAGQHPVVSSLRAEPLGTSMFGVECQAVSGPILRNRSYGNPCVKLQHQFELGNALSFAPAVIYLHRTSDCESTPQSAGRN